MHFMRDDRDGHPINGTDPVEGIIALDGGALDEVGGGITLVPIPPVIVIGAIIDGVVTGVKDAVGAVLSITKIF
jgi:hypothetical protein